MDYCTVFAVIHVIVVLVKENVHTTASIVADVFVSFTSSFPVDGGGVVRVGLADTASHRSVDTVQD